MKNLLLLLVITAGLAQSEAQQIVPREALLDFAFRVSQDLNIVVTLKIAGKHEAAFTLTPGQVG